MPSFCCSSAPDPHSNQAMDKHGRRCSGAHRIQDTGSRSVARQSQDVISSGPTTTKLVDTACTRWQHNLQQVEVRIVTSRMRQGSRGSSGLTVQPDPPARDGDGLQAMCRTSI